MADGMPNGRSGGAPPQSDGKALLEARDLGARGLDVLGGHRAFEFGEPGDAPAGEIELRA